MEQPISNYCTFEKSMTISDTVFKLESMRNSRSLWNYILYLFITRVTSDHIFSEAVNIHYTHQKKRLLTDKVDYRALRTQIRNTLCRKDRNQNPISNKYKIQDFLCILSRGINLLKITIICKFQHIFFKRMCTKYTFQITIIFNLVPFKKDLIK